MAARDSVAETLRGKRFALVGFDDSEVARMRAAAASAGAYAYVITPQPALPGLNSLAPFDVCLLNISRQEGPEAKAPADLMAMTHRPAILIGNRDEMGQYALVSLRHEFMIRPWVEEELLLRAFRLLRNAEEDSERRVERPSAAEEPTVIVADDDKTTVMLLSSMLRANGMRCVVAPSGAEALALAKKLKPDALLLDVSMPGMDGFEVLAALKNDPATRSIPVVMLTASHGEKEIVRGFSLGADDYITKPFQPQEMVARLRRLIPQWHAA